jgi:nucleoside-diphosphate-sugar epimerase
MRTILVTGAFGYLGSTLVPALLDADHRVLALDNLMYGNGAALAHLMRDPRLEVTVGDCRDIRVVKPLLDRADVILPLAAIVGAPACARDELGAESINHAAVKMLCSYASPQQLIVFPNTNSGYGRAGDAPVTEDAPLNPISLYGRTKCAAERAVLTRDSSVVLRLATAYGLSPRMRLDLLVNDFAARAVRDRSLTLFEGHHRRSIVHVADVADVFEYVITQPDWVQREGHVFNVVGDNVTKRELCEKIARSVPDFVWNEAAVGEDPDNRDYAVSGQRLATAGWRPQIALADGLAELIKGLPALLARAPYGNV